MAEDNRFDTAQLWYIIPGTIVLFSFVCAGVINVSSFRGSTFLLTNVTIAYVIGYLIHWSIYRYLYHLLLLYNRPAAWHFAKSLNVSTKEAEYLYNLLIYSKDEYKDNVSKFKKLSTLCSSLLTVSFAFFLGGIILVIMMFTLKLKLGLIVVIYLISGILFLINWIFHFGLLNNHEIVLINKVYFKNKKEYLNRSLTDIQTVRYKENVNIKRDQNLIINSKSKSDKESPTCFTAECNASFENQNQIVGSDEGNNKFLCEGVNSDLGWIKEWLKIFFSTGSKVTQKKTHK